MGARTRSGLSEFSRAIRWPPRGGPRRAARRPGPRSSGTGACRAIRRAAYSVAIGSLGIGGVHVLADVEAGAENQSERADGRQPGVELLLAQGFCLGRCHQGLERRVWWLTNALSTRLPVAPARLPPGRRPCRPGEQPAHHRVTGGRSSGTSCSARLASTARALGSSLRA